MLRKIKKNKKMNRLGISLMLSYVILISIAIALSIAVYAWLKVAAKYSAPTDCSEGTSVILKTASCPSHLINLTFYNNGYFNVDGVMVSVGNDSEEIPIIYLRNQNPDVNGIYGFNTFNESLKPGEEESALFGNPASNNKDLVDYTVRNVQVQPFIIYKNKKIFCTQSIIRNQQIPDCTIVES